MSLRVAVWRGWCHPGLVFSVCPWIRCCNSHNTWSRLSAGPFEGIKDFFLFKTGFTGSSEFVFISPQEVGRIDAMAHGARLRLFSYRGGWVLTDCKYFLFTVLLICSAVPGLARLIRELKPYLFSLSRDSILNMADYIGENFVCRSGFGWFFCRPLADYLVGLCPTRPVSGQCGYLFTGLG